MKIKEKSKVDSYFNEKYYRYNISKELSYYKKIYEELKLILDITYDVIVIADKNGKVLRISKSCEKVFGIKKFEMIGENAKKLEKTGVLSKSTAAFVSNNEKKVTLVQTTKAGRKLLVTGLPMFDESRNLIRIISVSKDITEKEKLRCKLNATEEQLDWYKEEMRKKVNFENDFVVGNSKAMNNIMELVKRVSSLNITVLLTGETGVGKSLTAKNIHSLSKRRQKQFIKLNCGAIPNNLLESELFGYVAGAFTGAQKSGKKGLIEAADGGTLFLDEICELPLHLQVKLLHVLEDEQIYRVGSTIPVKVNIRLISATNKNIKKLVEQGKFREDLYYRLNVVPINIPSLKERIEDISILVDHFLVKYNKEYGLNKEITSDALKQLKLYYWPGNIRELENIIKRLIVVVQDKVMKKDDVINILDNESTENNLDINFNEIMPLKNAKELVEKRLIVLAREQCETTREMASLLDIHQSTVVKKLQKFKI